ncbi:hypothetical protein Y032_0040g248 [Ancylostoma ceylanicum]|uniref:Uncharacterized protein n=1 Tax=Ancylostoma ceylanicum TaxID=53326 RepID=A0A016UI56_9BILA|nr:hypothetical protein Y032_0040g248 [Ancylostoma ceylanicum]
MKPFSLIHPNSSIAQYHAESLDERADNEGRSVRHQIPFYGLLLETTKPYICNVLPLPALAVLLFAKKVGYTLAWNFLSSIWFIGKVGALFPIPRAWFQANVCWVVQDLVILSRATQLNYV